MMWKPENQGRVRIAASFTPNTQPSCRGILYPEAFMAKAGDIKPFGHRTPRERLEKEALLVVLIGPKRENRRSKSRGKKQNSREGIQQGCSGVLDLPTVLCPPGDRLSNPSYPPGVEGSQRAARVPGGLNGLMYCTDPEMGLILLGKSFKGGTSLPLKTCQTFPGVRQGKKAPGREGLVSPTPLREVQGMRLHLPSRPVLSWESSSCWETSGPRAGDRTCLPQLDLGCLTPEGHNEEKGCCFLGGFLPVRSSLNSSGEGGTCPLLQPDGGMWGSVSGGANGARMARAEISREASVLLLRPI